MMIGNLKVTHEGRSNAPVILLPGLGCGPWIFDQLGIDLKHHHTVYSLTLAGFDGVPVGTGPLIEGIISSLLSLVETEALIKPAIVAHSIGGTVALEIISRFPELFGAAVIIDAAPRVLNSSESLEDRQEANNGFANRVFTGASLSSPESPARKWASEMVIREADLDRVLASWERSDRSTLTQFLIDGRMLAFELDLSRIQCPVSIIAPFEHNAERKAVEREFLEAYRQRPDFEIHLVGPARHFVMLDQPDATNEIVKAFLGRVLSDRTV